MFALVFHEVQKPLVEDVLKVLVPNPNLLFEPHIKEIQRQDAKHMGRLRREKEGLQDIGAFLAAAKAKRTEAGASTDA